MFKNNSFWEILNVLQNNEDKIKFITEVYNVFNICKKNKYNDKLQPLDPITNNPIHLSHLEVIDDECFDDDAILENIFTEEELVYQELLQEKTENLDYLIENALDSPILSGTDKEEIVNEAFYTKILIKINIILTEIGNIDSITIKKF